MPPTPGHPPLDFSLVGLAEGRGPKWVSFFEGEHGHAVWSVLLAHSVGDDELVVVKTALRRWWDRTMAGEVEGEKHPGKEGAKDFAFGLLLHMIDSGRPALEGEASLEGEERASYNRGLVTFCRGPRRGMEDVGVCPMDSGRPEPRRPHISVRPCVGRVQRRWPGSLLRCHRL